MKLTLRGKNSVSTKDSLYLFDLHIQESATNLVGTLVAASVSDFSVGIFLYENVQHVGNIIGHSGVITGLQFSQKDPFFLFTSSLDGTVRCWDLRTDCVKSSSILRGTPQNKFTSLSISNNGVLVAAGTELELVEKEKESYVVFWDSRTGACVGSYSESHTDDITQVKFHPAQDHLLATGSTDGLVCVYDLKASSEDDGLFSTMNTESSVHRLGWYSSTNLYALTHMDSVFGWEAIEADPLFSTKPIASVRFTPPTQPPETVSTNALATTTTMMRETFVKDKTSPVLSTDFSALTAFDYVADCFFDQSAEELLCIVGRKDTGIANVVKIDENGFIPTTLASIPSSHSDTIRSCALDSKRGTLLTGGEDGQICLWDFERTSNSDDRTLDDHKDDDDRMDL